MITFGARGACRAACLALAVALLGACATPEPALAPSRYVCEGGRGFTLHPHPGGESATLELNGMEFGMRREPAASGVRYACDVMTLWSKGEEATLEMEGRVAFSDCRLQRAAGRTGSN